MCDTGPGKPSETELEYRLVATNEIGDIQEEVLQIAEPKQGEKPEYPTLWIRKIKCEITLHWTEEEWLTEHVPPIVCIARRLKQEREEPIGEPITT